MSNVYQLHPSPAPDAFISDGPHLKGSGGGGTYDGMEARVKALESRTDRIEGKLDTIIEKVARMEGEVHRLPGYPGLMVLCGVLVGIVTLVVRFLPPSITP